MKMYTIVLSETELTTLRDRILNGEMYNTLDKADQVTVVGISAALISAKVVDVQQ